MEEFAGGIKGDHGLPSGDVMRRPLPGGPEPAQVVGDVGCEALQHFLVAAVVRPLSQAVAPHQLGAFEGGHVLQGHRLGRARSVVG
jgi:hypothetical protein